VPPFERDRRSRRIKPWISADEHDHLLKFDGGETGCDLIDAAFVEQQRGRDDCLADTLSSGPAQPVRVKHDSEAVCHGAEDIPAANGRHRRGDSDRRQAADR
jgi:hypothetical protein